MNTEQTTTPQLDRHAIIAAIERAKQANVDASSIEGSNRSGYYTDPTAEEVRDSLIGHHVADLDAVRQELAAAMKEGEVGAGLPRPYAHGAGGQDNTYRFIPEENRPILRDFFLQVSKKETLNVLGSLMACVDEAKLVAKDGEMTFRVVDPAHVCMVEIKGSGAKGQACIGLDLVKVKAFTSKCDETVLFTDLADEHKLRLHDGNGIQRDMGLVDISNLAEPRFPNITLPTSFVAIREDVAGILKHAADISDHVCIATTDGAAVMSAEGDVDRVRKTVSKKVKGPDSRSLFSIDYLSKLVGTAPKGAELTFTLGTDYPVRIEWRISGRFDLSLLLAPRIEREEEPEPPVITCPDCKVASAHGIHDAACPKVYKPEQAPPDLTDEELAAEATEEQRLQEAEDHLDDLAEGAAADADPMEG